MVKKLMRPFGGSISVDHPVFPACQSIENLGVLLSATAAISRSLFPGDCVPDDSGRHTPGAPSLARPVPGESLIMRPLGSEIIPDNVTPTQNVWDVPVMGEPSQPVLREFADSSADGPYWHCNIL